MADTRQQRCFFCGSTYPKPELLRGAVGAICRACVEALRELASPEGAAPDHEKATDQATRAVSLEELRRAREAVEAVEAEKAEEAGEPPVAMDPDGTRRSRPPRKGEAAAAPKGSAAPQDAAPAASPSPAASHRAPAAPPSGTPDAALLTVGDSTRLLDTLEGAEDDAIDLDKPVAPHHSAHDYQSRMDLAAALVEMGRRHAAVRELIAALESTLLCKDYPAALRCIAMARAAVDVPRVQGRLCEILARHAPQE